VRLFNLKHFLFAVDFLKTWLPGENITVDIVSFLGYFMRTWLLGVSFIISSSLLLILLASCFVEFLDIDCSIQKERKALYTNSYKSLSPLFVGLSFPVL
jgi:hypothetical protein